MVGATCLRSKKASCPFDDFLFIGNAICREFQVDLASQNQASRTSRSSQSLSAAFLASAILQRQSVNTIHLVAI